MVLEGAPCMAQRPIAYRNMAQSPVQTFPGLGYMARSTAALLHSQAKCSSEDAEMDSDTVVEIEDAAVNPRLLGPETITIQLWVVYAATFQVPALYFSAHHSSKSHLINVSPPLMSSLAQGGVPLVLAEILRLSLFRPESLPPGEVSSFSLLSPDSMFALLSQGDHPTLGTPCWYFHPCNTSEVVGEIMAEVERPEWGEDERSIRWLEGWFAVLGNIVAFPRSK